MNQIELVMRLGTAADNARDREEEDLAQLLDEAEAELERALAIVDKVETDEARAFVARHSRPVTEVDEHERQVLRHTLTGSSGTDEVYRNYFAASAGHFDLPTLERLISAKLMRRGKPISGDAGHYYHCTAAGAKAVGLHLPFDPREC